MSKKCRIPRAIRFQIYRDFLLLAKEEDLTLYQMKNLLMESPCGRWVIKRLGSFARFYMNIVKQLEKNGLVYRPAGGTFQATKKGSQVLKNSQNEIYNMKLDYIEEVTGQEVL